MNDYDRAAEIGGALQARLANISFPLDATVEREIQRLVFEYTAELRRVGQPPERVLMAVKYTANQAGIYATARLASSQVQLEGRDKLLVDMVKWCIERYYGQPPRAERQLPLPHVEKEARQNPS